jgi:sucrose-6-phosphate hydrolase SacC (GH32 family)
MSVVPAVEQLRSGHVGFTPAVASAARQKILDALRIHDLAAELKIELRPKADEFSLRLQTETGSNFAALSFTNRAGGRELRVDAVRAPLSGAPGSPVHLHIFLDGSVLEVFANGTTSLTKRVYQIPSGPLTLKLAGDAELISLDAWQMTPISRDRLTGSLCS